MSAPAPAALERLATALGTRFSTTLIQGEDRRPRLVVVDRRTRAATEVYADDHGWLWWPWAEPAAVTDDPQAAARRVSAVLRGTTRSGTSGDRANGKAGRG